MYLAFYIVIYLKTVLEFPYVLFCFQLTTSSKSSEFAVLEYTPGRWIQLPSSNLLNHLIISYKFGYTVLVHIHISGILKHLIKMYILLTFLPVFIQNLLTTLYHMVSKREERCRYCSFLILSFTSLKLSRNWVCSPFNIRKKNCFLYSSGYRMLTKRINCLSLKSGRWKAICVQTCF